VIGTECLELFAELKRRNLPDSRIRKYPLHGDPHFAKIVASFLGSIASGTLCAPILLSKNYARKSRNNFTADRTDNTDGSARRPERV